MPVLRIPVSITWPGKGSPGVNIFHARVSDVTLLADTTAFSAGQVLGELKTFYTSLAQLFPTSVKCRIGEVVNVETNEFVNTATPTDISGTASSNYTPAPTALVVGWRTSLAARRARGRTFLGPIAADWLDGTDGTPAAAAITIAQNAANALVTASDNVNGWALGVWGQQSQGIPEPKVLRDFTGARVRDQWAVLRSRRD